MNLHNLHNLCAKAPAAVIWITVAALAVLLFGSLGMLIYRELKNRKENKAESTACVKKEKPLDMRKVEEIKKELLDTARNSVSLEFEESGEYKKGGTRFGGTPDVPKNFVWPHFECSTFEDEEVKLRPLSFIAQFNLEELSEFDTENLLPKHGLLSFFHKTDAQNYGYKSEDMPCLKVFYFEDISALGLAKAPEDLSAECIFKQAKITATSKKTYMHNEDYSDYKNASFEELKEIWAAEERIDGAEAEGSRLLGWANWIQASEISGFELISKGYSLDSAEDRAKIPKEVKKQSNKTALFDWLLLLELDGEDLYDYGLMYGDVGNLYVFIKREDLLNKNFDKAYFTWQCG